MDAKRAPETERELRCHCGSLMARVTTAGIELKCRRCKRVVLVPAPERPDEWVVVPMR